jgi:hypothetical protein
MYSVTFVIVAAVFVAVVALATLWRRCRRHDVKARFRFRDGSRRRRVPRSPQISLRTFDTGYEKVPLAEAGGGQAAAGEDELSSSSDDDFYFKPTLNGDSDERRRLVTQSDAV